MGLLDEHGNDGRGEYYMSVIGVAQVGTFGDGGHNRDIPGIHGTLTNVYQPRTVRTGQVSQGMVLSDGRSHVKVQFFDRQPLDQTWQGKEVTILARQNGGNISGVRLKDNNFVSKKTGQTVNERIVSVTGTAEVSPIGAGMPGNAPASAAPQQSYNPPAQTQTAPAQAPPQQPPQQVAPQYQTAPAQTLPSSQGQPGINSSSIGESEKAIQVIDRAGWLWKQCRIKVADIEHDLMAQYQIALNKETLDTLATHLAIGTERKIYLENIDSAFVHTGDAAGDDEVPF